MRSQRFQLSIRGRMLIVLSCGCLCVLIAWVSTPQMTHCYRYCDGQMRQIALAMRSYQADYGCLPPAYIADAQGKPMHSWRVLLLPYLDQAGLYDAYNFGEPWDGP